MEQILAENKNLVNVEKKWIKGNGNIVVGSNCIVEGDNNVINGNNLIVCGKHCVIHASNSRLFIQESILEGVLFHVHGNKNRIMGSGIVFSESVTSNNVSGTVVQHFPPKPMRRNAIDLIIEDFSGRKAHDAMTNQDHVLFKGFPPNFTDRMMVNDDPQILECRSLCGRMGCCSVEPCGHRFYCRTCAESMVSDITKPIHTCKLCEKPIQEIHYEELEL